METITISKKQYEELKRKAEENKKIIDVITLEIKEGLEKFIKKSN